MRRLSELGCEVGAGDLALIETCSKRVAQRIKNFTNLSEIPEGLSEVFVERVCGEVLLSKLQAGETDCGLLGVKSVTEGDVSVAFSGGFDARELIGRMTEYGGEELCCYRKIRW